MTRFDETLPLDGAFSQQDGAAFLQLKGMVTESTTDRLRAILDQVLELRPRDLVIDARELEFVCSQGLVVLLKAAGRLPPRGRLVLDQPTESVRRAVTTMRLDRFITLADDRPVSPGPGLPSAGRA